jgi:DNA replication protein DnaC
MKPTDDELDALLKRLHLASARRIWRRLVEEAEKQQWSYRDFLGIVVAEEIAQRQQTRLQRLSHRAAFPFLKTIDDFNFTYQSTLRLSLLGSALSPDFITEGRCLILSGKPGRGKTHLAVAIAYRAIQNGFDAVFTTAAQLIDELSAAFRTGGLAAALQPYTHSDLLVVDEVGYLAYGTDAANMLFHVVNDRHKHKRSMIFTTNKSIDAWGRVLHDEDLAQAIVDRVLERGRLLKLDGPSIRTRHLGLDESSAEASNHGVTGSARISGIPVPEFPEPAGSEEPSSPAWSRHPARTGARGGTPDRPVRDTADRSEPRRRIAHRRAARRLASLQQERDARGGCRPSVTLSSSCPPVSSERCPPAAA